jgi:hypothetical protein
VPAGCAGYPAFWIEDMTLSLASGLISPDEDGHVADCIVEAVIESNKTRKWVEIKY